MAVGFSSFKYKMYYDHDIMEGSFGNAKIFEFTNYPKTKIPS